MYCISRSNFLKCSISRTQRYSCPSGPSDPVAQTLQTVPKAQGECICCDVILTNTFYPPIVPVATTTQWFQRPGPSVKVLRRAIQRLRCCIASLLLLPLHSRHFLRAFLSLWSLFILQIQAKLIRPGNVKLLLGKLPAK